MSSVQAQLSALEGRISDNLWTMANIILIIVGIVVLWICVVLPEMERNIADEDIFIAFNYYAILSTIYVIFSLSM